MRADDVREAAAVGEVRRDGQTTFADRPTERRRVEVTSVLSAQLRGPLALGEVRLDGVDVAHLDRAQRAAGLLGGGTRIERGERVEAECVEGRVEALEVRADPVDGLALPRGAPERGDDGCRVHCEVGLQEICDHGVDGGERLERLGFGHADRSVLLAGTS
jgi:hypothetical protein